MGGIFEEHISTLKISTGLNGVRNLLVFFSLNLTLSPSLESNESSPSFAILVVEMISESVTCESGGFLPDLRQTVNVALEAIRQSGVLFSE